MDKSLKPLDSDDRIDDPVLEEHRVNEQKVNEQKVNAHTGNDHTGNDDTLEIQTLDDPKLRRPSWRAIALALALLTIQTGLLIYRAASESYTRNEHAHLAAGVSHLEFGNYDLFRVNPPLVRTLAALGPWFRGYRADWSMFSSRPELRSEFAMGWMFVYANRDQCYDQLFLARLSTLWLVPLGGYFLWLWSRQIWGATGAWLSLCLWVFSPNMLAHGSLIAPDAGSAALGLISLYAMWHWFRTPTYGGAYATGLLLGLALLTKFTLLLWIPILNLLVGLRWVAAWFRPAVPPQHLMGQWLMILVLAWVVINLGYTFCEFGKPLGKFEFISQAFTNGPDPSETGVAQVGNRFADTWLGKVPVPLPKALLMGIDIQKWDFESQMNSYLCGEWKKGGWWYYYLVALAIKEPLGVWLLLLLASGAGGLQLVSAAGTVLGRRSKTAVSPAKTVETESALSGSGHAESVAAGEPLTRWLLRWLVPGLALGMVLVFVSLQTGINHHLRYVLGGLPFVYLLCGGVGPWFDRSGVWQKLLIGALVMWAMVSSLLVYPHSLAYFNEAIGGPSRGRFYLDNSNIDWGQDFLNLKRWVEQHPARRPLFISLASDFANPPPREWKFPPVPSVNDLHQALEDPGGDQPGLVPGWYVICVTNAVSQHERYDWLSQRQPIEEIGWSILVYELNESDIREIENALLAEQAAVLPGN